MLDEDDHDPMFTMVRDARPEPPHAWSARVLARLPVVRRRTSHAAVLGAAVAVAAIALLATQWPDRDDRVDGDPIAIAMHQLPAGAPHDASPAPQPQPQPPPPPPRPRPPSGPKVARRVVIELMTALHDGNAAAAAALIETPFRHRDLCETLDLVDKVQVATDRRDVEALVACMIKEDPFKKPKWPTSRIHADVGERANEFKNTPSGRIFIHAKLMLDAPEYGRATIYNLSVHDDKIDGMAFWAAIRVN